MQPLTQVERETYEWQIWARDFGEAGQERLKNSSALVTRCGGLGGVVAYELAAAGIGKLVIAHAGNVKPSDLNRQLLMTHQALGKSRIQTARSRLLDLNPRLVVEAVPENATPDNVDRLVEQVDVVVDCAPLFEERYLLNRAAVTHNKPMIECAMYDLEAHITTIIPGQTACLSCLCPEKPPTWKREFPVFGAVSGMAGCLGAMEAVKVVAQFGQTLAGKLLICDLREMSFRTIAVQRRSDCAVCGNHSPAATQPVSPAP
jgi:molybdopterin/thiamine biosynthesis adenylyltransferase